MSWCDRLASTPVVGVRLTTSFIPSEEILSAMAPVLNREVENDRPKFSVETMEPFTLIFITDSGLRYSFDHSSISVAFNHRMKAKPASGGPPTMELISRAAPYTELLDTVSDCLLEAVSLIPSKGLREIKRIGLVSLTQVELQDAPPGVNELFAEVGRPFGGKIDNFSVAISSVIAEEQNRTDRCVHTLTLPEKPETLITLQLDWQRIFVNPTATSRSYLEEALKTGKRDALAYFERVAEGGLSDGVDLNG